MKEKFLFLLIAVAIGCTSSQTEVDSNANSNFKDQLKITFAELDSSKILNSIGCAQGYFAHISPEFVLRIPASIYSEYESNKEYLFGEQGIQCELLVFEKDSSHLANICTDIIIVNYPEPIREIKGVKGKMKVLIGNKEELWGNEVNNAYIKIENVEFVDSLNKNRKIEIKDKYLWEVLNLGTSG